MVIAVDMCAPGHAKGMDAKGMDGCRMAPHGMASLSRPACTLPSRLFVLTRRLLIARCWSARAGPQGSDVHLP